MYGDLSQLQRLVDPNLAGVLYQQGRVFIDTDGNAQTQIVNEWQDTAGTADWPIVTRTRK